MKTIKYLKFLFKIFFYIILTPVAIIIILIRPIIHFKFGIIKSSKYGAFIGSIANYAIKKRKTENTKNLSFDFLSYDDIIINKQLKKMFDRKFKTFSFNYFIKYIEKLLRYLTKSDIFSAQKRTLVNSQDLEKLATENVLSFSKQELENGKSLISKLKIEKDDSIVCFSNRDDYHLKKVHPNQNWSHHDYRNFSIKTLLPAAQEFTKSNFYVVRYGSDAKEKFISKNNKIIDYTFDESRSDFLDIYLAYKSKAYFGSTSGTSAIFQLFGKPTFCMNCSLTLINVHIKSHAGLFLTKHLYHNKTKKFVGLKQMFDIGINNFARTDKFENYGIINIPNSEEELKNFAIESINHLKGNKILTPEDQMLQDKFWEIYFKHEKRINKNELKIQISPFFLRNNKYLLD